MTTEMNPLTSARRSRLAWSLAPLLGPLLYFAVVVTGIGAEPLRVTSLDRAGNLAWSNALTPASVLTVQAAPDVNGAWTNVRNVFATNSGGATTIALPTSNLFSRLLSVDISTNSPRHFTNLTESYGLLETVAGRGQFNGDKTSHWLPSYEGDWATNANLSRPHTAFGDAAGQVFIVDQGSGSILKVTPEGRIFTYAGTHTNRFDGDGPAPATNLSLNFPNGGWLGPDGTFYVLDTENGRVRKISTNGVMSSLIITDPMGDGRALWVRSDERLIYFGSGPAVGANVTTLNRWTPEEGLSVVSSSFLNMGNILGNEATGDLYISDRNANRVYRMDTNGTLTTIAGNGTQSGGGDGAPALETGLVLPRSVWFIPNGGFFIGEHDPGNRIWYVDPAGIIHLWVAGSSARLERAGDGKWFYDSLGTPKVSRVRAVNADPLGNLIITESNYGFVRRIKFERLIP